MIRYKKCVYTLLVPYKKCKIKPDIRYKKCKTGWRELDGTRIEWLIDCGLIARVYRVAKPAIPLKAYLEENAYKLFFLDIGLLGASSELDARTLLEGNRVFIEFKGGH